ncbi:PKD domain-containing protein [Aureispira anguillae]|uniref:PKD domain-containing protein n=1 Tax=Aureispira anguillae TaxID=2864201 RepID=A0A915YGT7_9BACT|nr:PKD domain-containing protein [Aureispira anguillae]BDS12772.1 PKD domain-containing protein [Aureispira anguillae]
MKNLFPIVLLGLVFTFSSCEKKLPLVASIQYSGTPQVGEQMTFSNQEDFSARYYWNFGDGTTYTDYYKNTEIYQTYTTAGTYDVTLTITRDQETAIATQSITIAP